MLPEDKILFENIKQFRHLITEGVGESEIINAIQNHEWIHLYYAGDGKSAKGSRTIRPYVLGIHKKSGQPVLRAWQDNPRNSHDFDNRETRDDSEGHDYWVDREGVKPGWRMFRLDKISHVYPIGRRFNNSDGSVMIPPDYNEGHDEDMSDIKYYVSTSNEPKHVKKHPEFTGDTLSKTELNKEKWDSIRAGNKNKVKITADDVRKLSTLASRVQKTSRGKYLVVVDDKNNFQLMLAKDKDKQNIPDTAIIDTLSHLIDSLLNTNVPVKTGFIRTAKDRLKQDIKNKEQNQIKETELPTIPFERKTFFK
jgi:hypothetical protein